ncbi:MAG TPA: oligosaccharide flippase family protein [Steroidobacteraceae bacterium]|nr:oligosaccharide flippase family protein [Steroidobacteraceae bacterium]
MTNPPGRIAAIRAAAFVTASTYLSYGLSLIVGAIAARSLGPDAYGRYAYVVWITGLLVMMANHGLTTSGIRFVAECLGAGQPAAAAGVHRWLLTRQLASLALILLLFAAWMGLHPPPGWRTEVVTLLLVGAVSTASKTFYLFDVSMGKGYGRFDVEPMTTIVFSVLGAIVTLVLAARGAPVKSYLVLFACSSVGMYLLASALLRRAGLRAARTGRLEPTLERRLRQHLLWTIVLTVGYALSNRSVETYLLATHWGAANVGFFTIAAGLTRGSVELLTVGLSAVLMPAMARSQGSGDPQQSHALFGDTFRFLTFLGLILAGSGWYWAEPAVRIFYGPSFEPAIFTLRVMLLIGGVFLFDATTGALLTTSGRQQQRAVLVCISTVMSLITGYLLVPAFGLTGAALSVAVVHIAYSLTMVVQSVQAIRAPLPWAGLLRLLLAAALAAVASYACCLLPLELELAANLLAGLVFALLFVALTVLLKAWTRRDVGLMVEMSERWTMLLGWLRPLLLRWQSHYTH